MSRVVFGRFVTTADIDSDRILRAQEGRLKSVVVLGFGEDGQFVMATSSGAPGEILLQLELAKRMVLEHVKAALPGEE